MTPARRAALAWFHEPGEVAWFSYDEYPPSKDMLKRMLDDGQLQKRSQGDLKPVIFSLTDKGRRMLNGDDK